MAYDEELTNRFRKVLKTKSGIAEKKMMGGVCFLLNGNMIGGANRNKQGGGRFMFRVGKDNDDAASKLKGGERLIRSGRKMSGFFYVDEKHDDKVLSAWMNLAVRNAETLSPK